MLKLYQAEACPFAERTHMVMLEKGLDYERVEIDLSNKPADFERISPYSKVPVLLEGETRVYESHIINEYLDERFPSPALRPQDAEARARMRIWIDFDNTKLIPAFYRVLLAQDGERRRAQAEALRAHLVFMEEQALATRGAGPYWLGKAFSLADISIFTHLDRMCVLKAYRELDIPVACGRIREWLAAVRERESARAVAHDEEYHIRAYARYADGTASGTTARDMLEGAA